MGCGGCYLDYEIEFIQLINRKCYNDPSNLSSGKETPPASLQLCKTI